MTDYKLADHGCAEQLKTFAINIVRFFVASLAGYTPEVPTTLRLTLGRRLPSDLTMFL